MTRREKQPIYKVVMTKGERTLPVGRWIGFKVLEEAV